MADTKTTKILEVVVDNDKAIGAIAEYNKLIEEQRARQAALTAEYKAGKIRQNDYYKAMAQSKEVTKTYSRQVQELSKEVQNNIKMDTEKKGSLRALRAELSNVTKAYDAMSDEERKSAKGMELKAKIQDITAELKNSEQETGRFYRNVGNYANGFVEAFTRMGGSMGALQGPMNLVQSGFTAISATPLIAIIGALVALFQKISQNLNRSEEAVNALTVALTPLNGATRLLEGILNGLSKALAAVVNKMTEWADKLGIIRDAVMEEKQLALDNIALQKREREVAMQNADAQLKVSQLRAQAADKLNHSAEERVELLKQAIAEEEAIAARELEVAKERYRIQQEQAKLAPNTTEQNEELTDSYVEMRQAEQAYYDKTRELQGQIVEATRQIRAEEEAASKARIKNTEKELTKVAEAAGATGDTLGKALDLKKREVEARLKLIEKGTVEEFQLKQEQLRVQMEMDLRRLESEEGTDELIRLRREQFTADMTALEAKYDADMQAHADALLESTLANIKAEQDARAKALEEQRAQEAEKQRLAEETAHAFSLVAGSIAGLLKTFAEENKELAQLSKVIALAQIAIETGVATAKGISSAMSVPYPANIAAIASTIATVLGGMTSAISTVKSAKFAAGGYVSGPGTATSDSVPARLSNGESVINARSTSMFGPLLSALNQAGGGVAFNPAASGNREGFEFLAAAVASGMKSVKLSVGVDEVTKVQKRVDTIKEVSTIG